MFHQRRHGVVYVQCMPLELRFCLNQPSVMGNEIPRYAPGDSIAGLILRAQTLMMRRLNKPSRLPAILSIIAATFAVYWPSLQNKFVWDDTALVLRDPFIRSWRLIPEGLRHFLFTDATASNFYRPIQRLVFTLDYAFFGFNQPWGYHFTSILLHAAAGVALYFFIQKIAARQGSPVSSRSGIIAWLAALAWAVHPLHTEAVCYISGSADVLAALFGFSGLYCGLCAVENKSRLCGWLAAFCFLAALLSKESGIGALIIWFAVLWCLGDLAALRRWLLIAAAILAVYCGLRFTAENTPVPPEQPSAIVTRPILIARAYGVYAGLLVAPLNLHMERDILATAHDDIHKTFKDVTTREYQTLAGVLLIAATFLWLRWTRRRLFPAYIFLIAFLIAYVPTSNLFSLNAHIAEHWLYFSSAFLFAAAAISLAVLPVSRGFLTVVFATWLGFLGARTYARNFDWKDQRTFLETTAMAGGDTARMEINLGQLESTEGRQDIAIAHFQNALAERPDQPFALLGLAGAYIRARDFDKARGQLQRARIIPFVHALALEKLAALEYQQSGTVRLDLLSKAASLEPDNWEIQSTYIKELAFDGQMPAAIKTLRDLLENQSYRSESWALMGDLLTKDGHADVAESMYARAREYDVHYGEAKSDALQK